MNAPSKLTDTQIMILSAASQRADRRLVAPTNLKGAAAHKALAKLLAAGLVREVKAKPGTEAWRRDKETGGSYALKVTAAGLNAIVVEDDEAGVAEAAEVLAVDSGEAARADAVAVLPIVAERAEVAPGIPLTVAAMTSEPREGTKIAAVIAMLGRVQGAQLDELVAATGWLPHTTRAALTALRHRGYEVRLKRGEAGRASVYLLGAGPAAAQ